MLIASIATYLKYFSDVASYGSFSQAAKKNFISQSAISQSVKKLEELLGFQLFEHDKNHFQLSPRGKVLFDKVQPLLRELDQIEECLDDLKEEKEMKFLFGCMHSVALAVIPQTLIQFKEVSPSTHIHFKLAHGGRIQELVKHGEVDFGVVLDNADLSSFTTVPIYQGHFEVFEHPTCCSKELIFSEPSFETNLFKRAYNEAYGGYPNVEMNVASWEVIASLVDGGLGRGYFPDYLQIQHPNLQKVAYPFSSTPYTMCAIFRKGSHISKPVEEFLNTMKNLLNNKEMISGSSLL